MLHGFTKGVSMDILEYNLPYMQSDFMCNLGLTKKTKLTKEKTKDIEARKML